MQHIFRILILVIGLLILFSTTYAPEFPKALEPYYSNPDARYGPAVGTCRTDADCARYNYDKNTCLATWASYLDHTVPWSERRQDWRVIRWRNESDPLWPYIGQRWYSPYMYTEKWRYKCIDGKCYLDTERSKTERVFCEYGCDLWLQHCLCMPRDLYEFRCSDDLSGIEGAGIDWTCEKIWVKIIDCAAMGARCGEDPRHPGYLACVKETGSLVPTQGSQYATLYPIHGGKPITVAVNTATTTASRTFSRSGRTVTGYSVLSTRTISRTPTRTHRTSSSYRTLNTYKRPTTYTYRRTYYKPRTTYYRTYSRTYKPTYSYSYKRYTKPRTSYTTYSRRTYTRKWIYRRTHYPWTRTSYMCRGRC